jgi:CubicO group peptidase (beta-lactamase class C family)
MSSERTAAGRRGKEPPEGVALTAITGKPVEELIRERIVEPLGMQGTESHQTAVIPEPVLHAYTRERGTYVAHAASLSHGPF